MTRGASLVVAALLVAPAYVPAATAAPATTLTITTQRSAAMTVRLLRAAKFYLGEPGDDGPVVRIKGGGEFAGFLLIPTHQDAIGQMAVRRDGADPAYFTAGDPVTTVPAGTYVLHVAASAPVTITVPVTGLPRTTWRPSAPLTTGRAAATWDLPLGPTLTGTAQVALRTRSVAVFLLEHHMTGQQYSNVVCLTRTSGACGQGAAWESRTDVLIVGGPQLDRPAGSGALADRVVKPGTYTVRWEIEATGVAGQPVAAAYVIG